MSAIAGEEFALEAAQKAKIQRTFAPVQAGFTKTGQTALPYAPNRLLVQIKADAMAKSLVSNLGDKGAQAPSNEIGLESLDVLADVAGVVSVERPYIRVKNVDKAADLGVDRWLMYRFENVKNLGDLAAQFRADKSVQAVSMDWIAYPTAVPNDPLYPNHWGHNNTAQLPDLDWGGTYGHTLSNTVGTPGFDTNAQAAWDGSQGYGSAGSMYFSAIQNAIYHAADNGADVISMSSGAAISSDSATDAALLYAYNKGVTMFAATGNENASTISYPAINQYVIGVGAASPCGDRKRSGNSSEVNPGVNTDPNGYTCDGERWWGSNYGVNSKDAAGAVDILAPTILPTTDLLGNAGYESGDYSSFFNGTSCATPYAAGAAALVISKNPTYTYTTAGTYTVAMTAANAQGSDAMTRNGYITATDPANNFATLPYSTGFEGGAVDQFWTLYEGVEGRIQVTSANTPHSGSYQLTMDDAVNGGSYSNNTWQNFAVDVDAEAAAAGLSLTGNFVIKFQQYDNYGISSDGFAFDDISITAGAAGVAPVSAFSGAPTSGTAPLAVSFTDASTNAPTSWSWTFGDGGTSTAQNPSHSYAAAGTYTVGLDVSNAFGSDVNTKTGYISVTVGGGGGVWQALSSSDFESGLQGWADGGSDCRRSSRDATYAYGGTYCVRLRDNTSSSTMTQGAFDATGYAELEVAFYFYPRSMENNEDFWLQFYNGSSWQTVGSWAAGAQFNNNSFYTSTVNITSNSYNFGPTRSSGSAATPVATRTTSTSMR